MAGHACQSKNLAIAGVSFYGFLDLVHIGCAVGSLRREILCSSDTSSRQARDPFPETNIK